MTVSPVASEARLNEALTAIGAELLGTTEQTLWQQILVASAISGFPAPTGFTATAGNQQINLTWDAQPAADTFTIKFGITNVLGAASVLTSSATGTSFVFDSGESIQAGEKYYFWISAIGSEGTSSFRGSVTARSFVTLANLESLNVVTPQGTWTLRSLFFGISPSPIPDFVNAITSTGTYFTLGGEWLDSVTEDPSDGVPTSGAVSVTNNSGANFTFWNGEP